MSAGSVLINAISVRMGGAETFLTNLAPLLAQRLSGWQFRLLVRQSRCHLYRETPENVHLEAIPDAAVASVTARLRFEHGQVPTLHRRGGYSLHFQADEMLSPRIPWLNLRSLAVFHTTPMVMLDGTTGDNPLLVRYARWIRRNTARRCTIPVTVSYHAMAELSGLYPFARDRFRVVYHGVDQRHYSPDRLQAPGREPCADPRSIWGGERPYILSISNRFQWKNYYRLIQAFHRLLTLTGSTGDCDLVLIGRAKLPAEETRIAEYLTANRLWERVHLVDYVEQARLPDVYRGALAYVFPSLRETFGMTVLEAMACGVPVACGRWGPLPEIAGDAACYFDPLDVDDMARALEAVCRDQPLRSELAGRGLQHAAYFTWQRAAEGYARLILEAVNR